MSTQDAIALLVSEGYWVGTSPAFDPKYLYVVRTIAKNGSVHLHVRRRKGLSSPPLTYGGDGAFKQEVAKLCLPDLAWEEVWTSTENGTFKVSPDSSLAELMIRRAQTRS